MKTEDPGQRYESVLDKLEIQIETNQKMLNFLLHRGLLSDFREWEGKSKGILSW